MGLIPLGRGAFTLSSGRVNDFFHRQTKSLRVFVTDKIIIEEKKGENENCACQNP